MAKAKSAKSAKKKSGSKNATPSLDDLQAQLAGTTKPKAKGKKKKERLTLDEFPEVTRDLIEEFVEKKTVLDLVEKPFDEIKKAAKDAMLPIFVDRWYDTGALPQNPLLHVKDEDGKVDHECMFQLTEKFYPDIDLGSDDVEAAVIKTLTDAGVTQENAELFFEKELDCAPVNSMHSISRLSKGHKEGKEWIGATNDEKRVAEKILKFALGQETEGLTDEERALAIYVEPNVTVSSGVFQRLHTYARSPDDMIALIKLLNPVYYLSKAKFAVNDNPAERNERLTGVVSDLAGIDLED